MTMGFDRLQQVLLILASTILIASPSAGSPYQAGTVQGGSLTILTDDDRASAVAPLETTEVRAEITGLVARVRLRQRFVNPLDQPIEAIYTFPLPQRAAVQAMTIQIGDRALQAEIRRREDAQRLYEAARDTGRTAALLDQERPNIFNQSVTHIGARETIVVALEYVETLEYEDGTYRWVFPMVVGPRYIPGIAVGRQGSGRAPDTDRVPDASRITPPVAAPGTRSGHDVSLEVVLNTGQPPTSVSSRLHEIETEAERSGALLVHLKSKRVIPNRDFILEYSIDTGDIGDSLLAHRSAQDGFFTLVLQPPARPVELDRNPKELVFVLDTSGSMQGFPIEKAKETMRLALGDLQPEDRFNLITFAGDTQALFPEPVPATRDNLAAADAVLAGQIGSGGTEMMKAIRAALAPSTEGDRVRVVCLMTDGYVGNEQEILDEIRRRPGARVFAFGIGNAVNRFLLDKMALYGRGEVEYVTLADEAARSARRFRERIRQPVLTDIAIDWNSLPVSDVLPRRIPDLFSSQPVVLYGRYSAAASGSVTLTGTRAGQPFTREIPVSFPDVTSDNPALPTLWARHKVEDLVAEGGSFADVPQHVRNSVARLGLEFGLVTAYTSFVVVDRQSAPTGVRPDAVPVPVELPEGVSYTALGGAGVAAYSVGFDLRSMWAQRSIAETTRILAGFVVVTLAGIWTLRWLVARLRNP